MNVLATGMEWFTERPGGLSRYFADYLDAFDRSGVAIRGLVQSRQSKGGALPANVTSVRLNSHNPFTVKRVWADTLRDELSMRKYDVFNPHFAYYAWGFAEMKVDLPVVTHFHGPWAHEALWEAQHRSTFRTTLRFWLQRAIERRVYHATDQFIVLSEFFRKQLATHYDVPNQRIHVVPGAVDITRFHDTMDRSVVRARLQLPEHACILVAVRRLVRRMGLDLLVRAVASLRADIPNLHLVLVGAGSQFAELADLVQSLGLERHVTMTGRVADDLLPLYYQAADMAVTPSLALEGFGLSTVEAMACGTPVMGTRLGGTEEILQGFCPDLLFSDMSAGAIYEGLGRMLGESQRLPTRQQVRDYVTKHYTWDVVIPKIRAVFDSVGS